MKPIPETRRTRSTIVEREDATGTYWTLKDAPFVPVEVFWSHEVKTRGHVCLRQECLAQDHVDLISLSIGQAYDLLTALSAALDIPYQAPPTSGARV